MVYFLANYNWKLKSFLVDGLKAKGIRTDYILTPETKSKLLNWSAGAIKAIIKSNRRDVILCNYDFQAVLCYWLCWITFRKRRIVAINILLKEKNTIRNKIVTWMYRIALHDEKWMKATVTSIGYGEKIQRRLHVSNGFPLVRDWYGYSGKEKPYDNKGKRIFCGGSNGRDWDKVIRIAKLMPDYHFLLVMPSAFKKKYGNFRLKNVNLRFDLPFEQFISALSQSTFVLLPVDTDAPAGLVVMFQAAFLGRLVFTNSNSVLKEYIGEDNGIMIDGGENDYVSAIQYYQEHTSEACDKVCNFQHFLQNNCSEDLYCESIYKILYEYES